MGMPLSQADKKDRFIMLTDCRHLFEFHALDEWFRKQMEGTNGAIKLMECPTCRKPIRKSVRYGSFVNAALNDIEKVKKEILRRLHEVTEEEKKMVVRAVNLTQGHWFKCRNGHPYAVGECGGPMEVSVCPECKEPIGGTQHRAIEGNRLAPEIDGAVVSAYPAF